jgi:hypothetical protein
MTNPVMLPLTRIGYTADQSTVYTDRHACAISRDHFRGSDRIEPARLCSTAPSTGRQGAVVGRNRRRPAVSSR